MTFKSPGTGFSPSSSSGGMSGTLSTGKIPKASGSSALADSNLSDTGTLLAGNSPVSVRSVDQFGFSSSAADASVAADSGLGRDAAAIVKVTDGSSGKGWLSNRAGHARKTSDQAVTSSVTLTDLSDLSVTLVSGRNYQFRAVVFVNKANSLSGIRVALQGTATFNDLRYSIDIYDMTTRAIVANGISNALGTTVSKTTISTGENRVIVDGCCSVNTGGTLKIQGAQGTVDANATTFRRGSCLLVEDIP